MLANMEWYRAFYFTAKTGSLSRAAEQLYITQPAVSHAVKQLEAKLGVQLFFRTPKGARLTAEGEMLFTYVEQAYHFMATGEQKIAGMRELASGEIKVGAGDTLCRHVLLPYLKSFHETYPDIRIQVTNRTSRETATLLKEGKIDFGIVNLPLADDQLEVRESLELQDCFVAGGKYAGLAERPLTLDELFRYPLILLETGSSSRHFFDRYVQSRGLAVQPEIELGSIDLLMQFAAAGFGVACVVRNFAARELACGDIVEIPLVEPLPQRNAGLITLKGVPLSAAAKRFIAMLPLQ